MYMRMANGEREGEIRHLFSMNEGVEFIGRWSGTGVTTI